MHIINTHALPKNLSNILHDIYQEQGFIVQNEQVKKLLYSLLIHKKNQSSNPKTQDNLVSLDILVVFSLIIGKSMIKI